MSRVFDEHRQYLEDPVRIGAFRAAIAERVRPGDVVVDLGAGTGILGLLACQAGAARVYAIERTGLIEVAKRIARANGFESRVVYIRRLSLEIDLPERVDGIVCDQIGHFGFEAGLFEIIADARCRFLKPGGWIVPHSVDLDVAPISDPDIAERIRFWSRPVAGLDFSAAREWAANTGYPKHLDAGQLLGPAATIAHIEMSEVSTSRVAGSVRLTIEREGTLDAIGGWFTARLSPTIVLTNAPGAERLNRRNVVLPLDRAITVAPGDSIELRVQILPANAVLTWRGVVRTSAGESTFARSTLAGMLLTPDDLRRTQPDGIPTLTDRGVARLTVLQLCDGHRTLAEIERELLARHPTLFRSPEAAAIFVNEVVSVYSQ